MHPIKSVECKGELIKHAGSFIVELGEHSGHKHVLTVERPRDLEIRKDSQGNYYFHLKAPGKLTHDEHKELTIAPGTYKKVIERELDHFADAVQQVVD